MLLAKAALHDNLANDTSLVALKVAIIVLALVFIMIALLSNNKWILAGTFLYMAVP